MTRCSSWLERGGRWPSLPAEEKNRMSHRGRAFAALRPVLESLLAERADQVARLA